MLTDAPTTDFADASPLHPAYTGRVRAVLRRVVPAEAPQAKAPTAERSIKETGPIVQRATDETDWAAVLLQVRDTRDETAFAALFRHFAPRVKAFLMKSGADATLAEECAQDVMATLWHKAHLYDPARASVATWIFTIARNRRIDALRRARRPEPEDLTWGPDHEPDQAEVLAQRQDSARLGAALTQLPAKQRELIEQAYFGDRTHTEIAAATGLPLGTIKSRIRLALDRLRHELKKPH